MDFGKMLDDFIAVFSPKTALERRNFRDMYGAYSAASPTRKDLPFGVDGRAEQINSASRDIILKRCRNAERNSDILNALIYALVNNVVGVQINMQADTPNKKFNKLIEDLFHEWEHKENCDITKSQSLTEMAKMILTRWLVDGGILVNYVTDKKSFVPLKIQLREVDEITDKSIAQCENGNVICNGIELTKSGEPVAYYLRTYDPNGLVEDLNDERIPADRIDFIWQKTRPSQFREISPLARSVVRINDIDDYNDTFSFRAKIAACSQVFIETDNFNTTPGRNVNTANGEHVTQVRGGSVTHLNPGEHAKQFTPAGESNEFENFIVTQQRILGASHGLSLESASRNVERVNYSSARQNMLADQKTYKALRNFLVEHFFRQLYKRFIKACMLNGLLDGVGFDPNDPTYYKAKWLTDGIPWIDPLKEANANTIQLTNGGMSFQEYCANNGADWRERLEQMAEVKEYAEELGLNLSFILPDIKDLEEGESDNAEQGEQDSKTS